MTRDLFRRLQRLESRSTVSCEPLVIIVNSIPPDHVLAPGERVVQDELHGGPLLVLISERITSDRSDQGVSLDARPDIAR